MKSTRTRNAERNTALQDSLTVALAKNPKLRIVKPPSPKEKARLERIEQTTRRLQRRHSLTPVIERPAKTDEAEIDVAVAEPEPEPTNAEIEAALATIETPDQDEEEAPLEPPIVAASEQASIPQAPPPALIPSPLPADLAWLEQDTPFQHYLSGIVNRLRDTKARLNFTLEQCLSREKALQALYDKAYNDLTNEQEQIETLHTQIGKVNNNLASCALVAEQSIEIASLLASPAKHVTSVPGEKRKFIKPLATDPSICRKVDVLKFFQANPDKNWGTAEIKANMPAAKQCHAKKSVPPILANLAIEGKIKRVTEGVYRLA